MIRGDHEAVSSLDHRQGGSSTENLGELAIVPAVKVLHDDQRGPYRVW